MSKAPRDTAIGPCGWRQTEGNGDPGALKESAGPLKEFSRPFSPLHSFAQSQSCLNTTADDPSHCLKPILQEVRMRAKCNIDFNLKLEPSSVCWIGCLLELPGRYLGNTTNNNPTQTNTLSHTQPEKRTHSDHVFNI